MKKALLFLLFFIPLFLQAAGLGLYYWQPSDGRDNFGDYLLKIVERMVDSKVKRVSCHYSRHKLLAAGSIFQFAEQGDIIWGSGINGSHLQKRDYHFSSLDVRAVRGPLTAQFLKENFNIDCPKIYGDPALLLPRLFPEFKRNPDPEYDFIIIPHISEEELFLNSKYAKNVVCPTEPWNQVIKKILNSRFVISSSLHGVIVAESFGIPARLLLVYGHHEPDFKYQDYYQGTGRPDFKYARSVQEALMMGGERPFECDLEKLYSAFPFEFWPVR